MLDAELEGTIRIDQKTALAWLAPGGRGHERDRVAIEAVPFAAATLLRL